MEGEAVTTLALVEEAGNGGGEGQEFHQVTLHARVQPQHCLIWHSDDCTTLALHVDALKMVFGVPAWQRVMAQETSLDVRQ